jgi:hypothetical protein
MSSFVAIHLGVLIWIKDKASRSRRGYWQCASRLTSAPWTIEEANAVCFIVRDANGQALAFVYCEDEPGRRTTGKLLTRDEARRIAANIAKLPEWCASCKWAS